MPSQVNSRNAFFAIFPSIALPIFIALVDQSVITTAMPFVASELGEVGKITWPVTAYLIAAAVAAPIYGRLGDMYGRKRLMAVGLVVSTIGSILCHFATSMDMLTSFRVVQGMGAGGLMALSSALVGQAVGPRERGRYQAYIATVAVTANALGPVIGGFMTDQFGWRSIFLLNPVLVVVALVLLARLKLTNAPSSRKGIDIGGAVILAIAFASFVISIDALRQGGLSNLVRMTPLIVICLASVVLLFWWERRVETPLLPRQVFSNPSIRRSNAMAIAQGCLILAILALLPVFLRVNLGLSASEIGKALVPMVAATAVGASVTGKMVNLTGWTTLFPGIGFSMLAIMLGTFAFVHPHLDQTGYTIWFTCTTIWLGTVMPTVQIIVLAEGEPQDFGAVTSVTQLSRSFGAATGTAIVPVILLLTPGFDPQALSDLLDGTRGDVEIAWPAFRNVFFALSGIAAIGAVIAARVPLRSV
ncbi:MFS transporter [Pseudooceanicola sp.]|uniref:MFS transporter n=1 Tax=Pseudooceanicola sp. TaxID=1914328 RepID=UPI00261E1C55|nr:MFS transporter [Pseudooceanicola sp.]MDF1857078.1 MFS transporter [Pseudooceanicola sp.]